MNNTFFNAYEDAACAETYATLDFPGTYYLAFRDIPVLIAKYVKGRQALDFGCGAGRSTRFLKNLGFEAWGVDISARMLSEAFRIDPKGDYFQVKDDDLSGIADLSMDLVFSAFTFDNIPSEENKLKLFEEFGRILRPDGIFINLVSNPEIYINEWASFTTKDFPENHLARTGEIVRIINTSAGHTLPVQDILFPDWDYKRLYYATGLTLLETHRPLGKQAEPFTWISETNIPPWAIFVLST
ncbi:MAG: class I SAM-dependent methyltransferase [Bacteroidetes bacterium]|nr:class I SAM-dependent methyltransferase [Bacteroidota bacterium]